MINRIMYYIQRPEKDWDPVSEKHAKNYATDEYMHLDLNLVNKVEEYIGGYANKRILDLGSGPGQYAIEFAKRGANVTWYDISRNYYKIAQSYAQKNGVNINYEIGYMDDAKGEYDLVFNRVCWFYCINDREFANKIYTLVKPGGYAYLIINNENYFKGTLKEMSSMIKKIKILVQFYINEYFNLKLGHPCLSSNKAKRLFSRYKFQKLSVVEDTDRIGTTIVKFLK